MRPTDTPTAMIDFARDVLGEVHHISDPALPARLARIASADARQYAIKRHTSRERFERELAAYRDHLEPLRDATPRLVAHDVPTRTLLLTWIIGRSATTLEAGSDAELKAHHDAGVRLGRLHRAASRGTSRTIGPRLADRLTAWHDRAGGVLILTGPQRRLIDAASRYLASTPMELTVCHLDFQPRNWHLDSDGNVSLLDFEHMRPDALLRDFARSWWRHWADQPRLRQAFLDGYGIAITDTHRRILDAFGPYEALTAIVRGQEAAEPELYDFGRSLLESLT